MTCIFVFNAHSCLILYEMLLSNRNVSIIRKAKKKKKSRALLLLGNHRTNNSVDNIDETKYFKIKSITNMSGCMDIKINHMLPFRIFKHLNNINREREDLKSHGNISQLPRVDMILSFGR